MMEFMAKWPKATKTFKIQKKKLKVFPLKKNFINLKNATSKSKRQNLWKKRKSTSIFKVSKNFKVQTLNIAKLEFLKYL